MIKNTCKICTEAKRLVSCAMDQLHKFDLVEVSALKLSLLALGILLGTYWHKQFKKISPLIWLLFIAAYGYVLFTLFFKKEKDA